MVRDNKHNINEDFDFNKVKSTDDYNIYMKPGLLMYRKLVDLLKAKNFVCRPIKSEYDEAIEVIALVHNKKPNLMTRTDIKGFMRIAYNNDGIVLIQADAEIKCNDQDTKIVLNIIYNNKILINDYKISINVHGFLVFETYDVLLYFINSITLENIRSFNTVVNIYIMEYNIYNTYQTPEMHQDYVKACDALIKKFGNLIETIHLFPYSHYSKWEYETKAMYSKYYMAMDYRCFPVGIFNNVDECTKYLTDNGYKFLPAKTLGELLADYLDYKLSDELPDHRKPEKITPRTDTKTLMLYMIEKFNNMGYIVNNVKNVKAVLDNDTIQLKVINGDLFKLDWMPVKVQLAYIGYITYTAMKHAKYLEDESHKLKYK